jgi:hypothetical protein
VKLRLLSRSFSAAICALRRSAAWDTACSSWGLSRSYFLPERVEVALHLDTEGLHLAVGVVVVRDDDGERLVADLGTVGRDSRPGRRDLQGLGLACEGDGHSQPLDFHEPLAAVIVHVTLVLDRVGWPADFREVEVLYMIALGPMIVS